MTHPLHPKLIDALSEYKTCPEAMQAAADWQLAQCLDYIRTTQGDNAMVPFMEAMRPQEDN